MSYLKWAASNLSSWKIFPKKKKSKFRSKNALFGYFWAGIWKKPCHILNEHPRLCLIAKFREIVKMPKFGTRNAKFPYFGAVIWRSYCHILNQCSLICPIAKFDAKMKIFNFRTQNACFGILGMEFKNNVVIS